MPSRPLSLFVPLFLALPSLTSAAPLPESLRQSLQAGRPFVSGELLLQFRAGGRPAEDALLRRYGAQALERLAAAGKERGNLLRVRLQGRAIDQLLLQGLADEPELLFAEPNWIYQPSLSANPNDPYLANLWGMLGAASSPSHPYGSGALSVWNADRRCAADVVVGIIDEGLMINHPDLRANVWVNPLEKNGAAGVDDDGNGYVDDLHGWDFDGNNASVYDGPIDDHGSHVAGTVAASADNAIGVFGVCPRAKLIAAKFLGRRGGTTANAVKAVDYLTQLKQRHGLRLVASNNSWGGGGYSKALADAITRAGTQGILFIAAAGNAGVDIDQSPSYPASYGLANMLAVAALQPSGGLPIFSNYGARSVQLAAPGVKVLSTVPTRTGQASYAYYDGTSMATPHVTGAAALYASLNRCASAAQIRGALLAQAAVDPNLQGLVQGARRLNVAGFAGDLGCP